MEIISFWKRCCIKKKKPWKISFPSTPRNSDSCDIPFNSQPPSLKKVALHRHFCHSLKIFHSFSSYPCLLISFYLSPCRVEFPGDSVAKNPPANAGDTDSTRGSGRFPGEENGNPFQNSCLRNPLNRGAWWATVHGVTESDMT